MYFKEEEMRENEAELIYLLENCKHLINNQNAEGNTPLHKVC